MPSIILCPSCCPPLTAESTATDRRQRAIDAKSRAFTMSRNGNSFLCPTCGQQQQIRTLSLEDLVDALTDTSSTSA